MKARIAFIVLLAAILVAFLLPRESSTPADASAPARAASRPASAAPGVDASRAPSSAANAAARGSGAPAAAPRRKDPTAPWTVRPQLVANNDWKEMFERIEDMTWVPQGERLRYQAIILDACSHYATARAREARRFHDRPLDEITEQMTAKMSDVRQKDAMAFQLQRRITYVCRGFAQEAITREEVNAFYAQAAAAGDPVGVARTVEQALVDTAMRKEPPVPDPITPEQQQRLVASLFSGDPLAIRAAGRVLSLAMDIGPHAEQTWTLVACQFGFECGAANMAVTGACANRGQCADDYLGYLRNYALTPEQFAQVEATATAIAAAIRRRDAGAFQLVSRGSRQVNMVSGGLPPITVR